jgi:hypothetical protein
MLSNNIKQVVAFHNEQQAKVQPAAGKKKNQQPVQLSETDVLADYKYLPF